MDTLSETDIDNSIDKSNYVGFDQLSIPPSELKSLSDFYYATDGKE